MPRSVQTLRREPNGPAQGSGVVRRLLDRAHRRFRRARSGSVLILVIALLVLMALIGTAFITTTRTDRQASTQNEYNTQVELLVQAHLPQPAVPPGRLPELGRARRPQPAGPADHPGPRPARAAAR